VQRHGREVAEGHSHLHRIPLTGSMNLHSGEYLPGSRSVRKKESRRGDLIIRSLYAAAGITLSGLDGQATYLLENMWNGKSRTASGNQLQQPWTIALEPGAAQVWRFTVLGSQGTSPVTKRGFNAE